MEAADKLKVNDVINKLAELALVLERIFEREHKHQFRYEIQRLRQEIEELLYK